MKTHGFTLVELLVVIVIMGILRTVAVPKLFGMIAKSKAAELNPAAQTYVKLQETYVSERGTVVGNWTTIGFKEPSSINFTYTDPDLLGARQISKASLIRWAGKP